MKHKCCLQSKKEVREAVITERRALATLVDWIESYECDEHSLWHLPFHPEELARRYAFTAEHEESVLQCGYKLPDWRRERLRILRTLDRYPYAKPVDA